MATSESVDGVVIYYDGECPVCNHWVAGLRLKTAAGALRLVDAREGGDEVRALQAAGYDLDREMVVRIGDRTLSGAEAMHGLTLMATPSGLFNRGVYHLFRSERLSRPLYPVFRGMRLALLRLLGRSRINGVQGE